MKKKDWDHLEYQLTNRYNSEGIAELCRRSLKKGKFFNHQELVAWGITAFLSQTNDFSFLHSLSNGSRNVMVSANVWFDKDVYKNPNGGKDVTFFFRPYFECCISRLRIHLEKSENELILIHLELEEKYYKESEKFYKEPRSKSEKLIIKTIRKATLYYPEWVRENYLKDK